MRHFLTGPARIRRASILLIAVIAIGISWVGSLDKHSEEYVTQAMISGGLVYATARSINAAVSVMQGTEITPAIGTFAVGEVLDPINDLIERFSALLLIALGSLALQMIMLEIFSHAGFSILLTLLGLMLFGASISSRLSRYFPQLFNLFALTLAVRLALSAVVLASAGIDHVFLESKDKLRHEDMKRLEGELQTLSSSNPTAATPEQIEEIQAELNSLRKAQSRHNFQVNRLREELDALGDSLSDTRSDVSWGCRVNPWCDEGESVNEMKKEMANKEGQLNTAETIQASTEASIRENREALDCARREQAGESCSFWGRAYSWVSPTAWMDKFRNLGNQMNYYANNIINLLVSYLAKTLLIPLLFLYVFIRVFKRFVGAIAEVTAH